MGHLPESELTPSDDRPLSPKDDVYVRVRASCGTLSTFSHDGDLYQMLIPFITVKMG